MNDRERVWRALEGAWEEEEGFFKQQAARFSDPEIARVFAVQYCLMVLQGLRVEGLRVVSLDEIMTAYLRLERRVQELGEGRSTLGEQGMEEIRRMLEEHGETDEPD